MGWGTVKELKFAESIALHGGEEVNGAVSDKSFYLLLYHDTLFRFRPQTDQYLYSRIHALLGVVRFDETKSFYGLATQTETR